MKPAVRRVFERVALMMVDERKEEFMQIGAAEITLDLLRLQVGRLNRAQVEQIRALPVASLKRLGKALLRFKTRADLDAWLQSNVAKLPAKRRVQRIASNGGK